MLTFLLSVSLARAGGLWDMVGPMPAGSRLVGEDHGQDLVRFGVEGVDGAYWMDVTLGEAGGFCHGGGLVVQVRRDLAAENESFDLDPVPAPVEALCAALPRLPGRLGLRPPEVPVAGVYQPGGEEIGARYFPVFKPRPSQVPVGLAVGAIVAWALVAGRRRLGAAALVGAVALVARLLGSAPTTLLGGDAAYERLTTALGLGELDRYYGETWPALMGLVAAALRLTGQTFVVATDHVFVVNLLASALAPVALLALSERMGLSRPVSFVTALGLAVLPHAVHLARIEDHFVLVSLLQLLTAAAALGAGRLDTLAALAGAGLLAHLRPEQTAVAAVLLIPLLARWRWLAFVLGAALVASRGLYLPPPADHSPITFTRLLDPQLWLPLSGHFIAGWTPPLPGLYVLAAMGLGVSLVRRRPAWAWVALATASTVLPYLPKDLPAADPMRFSLPATGWIVLLGGAALQALVERWRVDRRSVLLPVAVVAFGSLLPVPAPERSTPRPWAWEGEFRFLHAHWAEALREAGVPAQAPLELTRSLDGPVAWYDDSQDPQGAFARWLVVAGGAPVLPWRLGVPRPGDVVYRGTADRLAEGAGAPWPGSRCGLRPVAEEEVPPGTDSWVDFGAAPVRLTIYRVEDCRALETTGGTPTP